MTTIAQEGTTSFPRACSGLMYEAVPMMAPTDCAFREGRRLRRRRGNVFFYEERFR